MNLSINPEFKNLIPALDKNEYDQLEESILSEGCRESIVAWNNTIVDGHNRYEICTNHNIDFNVVHKEFESESHVKLWMIDNQLGRRNLTDFMRIELNLRKKPFLSELAKKNMSIGGVIGAEIVNRGSTILSNPENTPVKVETIDTRAAIAKASGKSEGTVSKVEQVIKTGDEQLIAVARSGSINITEAASLAKLEPEKRKAVIAKIEENPDDAPNAMKVIRGTLGTGENEWYTPRDYIERARRVMGEISLDPASNENAQSLVAASNFFTQESNGLDKDWNGNIWLNPPYAQPLISQFIEKLCLEFKSGRCKQAILLTHNYTDTRWFQEAAKHCSCICFTRGRVKFYSPSGAIAAPTQGQCFLYFGENSNGFIAEFSAIGFIAEVVNEV